jgi:hypothetical protein
MQVGLDKLNLIELKAPRRSRTQLQRRACEISADYDSAGACQIQAHLSCAASEIQNACIAGNCTIDQARELASLGTCS